MLNAFFIRVEKPTVDDGIERTADELFHYIQQCEDVLWPENQVNFDYQFVKFVVLQDEAVQI